ncbi:putative aldo-keto reductase [Cercophora samala]|uniref:Aldo-keto reductase n=1 Tax=Cercophora samala TaxID=330535 RepID=A0AA40DF34_9PEZI|nr:putative aldo-keto reductase [Cercophora samala]
MSGNTIAVPTRPLGPGGPEIPILGLGLMGLSSFYGTPPSDDDRLAFLDRAHELGCTHWDSAALYGDSEVLLGKWFEKTGKRSDIFLATKFGNRVLPDGTREFCNEPEYIREAVKESLRKLKTNYIDLLYCHRISGKTPIEDVIETMKEFVESGQVRHIGLSECGADTLIRASKIHPIRAYQIEYSPFSRDIEFPDLNLAKTCRDLKIPIVAYSPLGRGMLTGKYSSADDFEQGDFRRAVPRFSAENFPKNMELVEKIKKIAAKKGCTPGQLTLAWMMKQDLVFPIPGTKKIAYLEENWGANSVYGTLTKEEEIEVREAIDQAEVYGTRYPPAAMGALVKDTPLRS